ncbi:hypothetical protein MFIFM68171_03601 [Madurella fahalii]|uniref:Ankyrin n=1 Tax=Madurella fahalii TaxID=1157608 RepID=A0ABQ0G6N1_9PEZI
MASKGSPLFFAIDADDAAALMFLLDHGYEPDLATWTMLGEKSLTSATLMASALRGRGFTAGVSKTAADVAIACSMLNSLISRRNADMIRFLLAIGLPVNYDMRYCPAVCRTPLQHAVVQGDLDIISVLLRAGAEVNASPANPYGVTALQIAAIMGANYLQALFLFGTNTFTYLLLGSAISWAGDGTSTPRVNYDLERADVNAAPVGYGGRTALEGAAEQGRIDMIELLLQHGAKTTGTGRMQFIFSIRFAEYEGHFAAAKLLREHRQWTKEDEKLMRELNLYASQPTEWKRSNIMLEYGVEECPQELVEVDDARQRSATIVGTVVGHDSIDEFVQWDTENTPCDHGGPTLWEKTDVELDTSGNDNVAVSQDMEKTVAVLARGVDPMWGG